MSDRDKTTSDITGIFDIDESTLKRWVADGCPHDKPTARNKPRKFNEAEVAAWMKETKRTGKPGRPTTEIGAELAALKLRKELALVLKYERENAVEDGKLIDAHEESARDVAKITTLRNTLCGMGASLSPSLVGLEGPEVQSLIDVFVETALKEFAR